MKKFGVEIELNSFDQRDFKKNPLNSNEFPLGIEKVAEIIKSLGMTVEIRNWQHTHNNKNWICKPDSSCGIEVCSPILESTNLVENLIDHFSKESQIKIDDRCSFHVHFDISNYSSDNLLSILCWWIKCESVFFDAFPDVRKNNRYCQCIGISDLFKVEPIPSLEEMIRLLGKTKYYSLNTYHLFRKSRSSIEFRLADKFACIDSNYAKNWILLLYFFIDSSIINGIPTSLIWMDINEVFEFLNLDPELKKWFLYKIFNNANGSSLYWGNNFRKNSILGCRNLLNNLELLDKDIESSLLGVNK